ncbi:MAG: sigma-70 family RNA polymerase sigma factor [Actinobacteria bacterium]|nr:sigma-70 family RNA polymerase sigma factor [Actinomycetota bacterium]
MSSALSTSPTMSRSLVARLDREWRVLTTRPAVLARAATWHLGVPFTSLDDIVGATGYWARRDDRVAAGQSVADGDAVLAALLVAARGDDLAARVVLQRLLPGIVAVARRWARRTGGERAALDELVAAAWTVVRTFPVERRTRHVASNLLRDTEYHAFVRSTRRLTVLEPTPTHLLDLPVDTSASMDPADELAELLAAARTLTVRDRALVELLVAGTPMAELAQAMEVSVRTVANHRDAVVHRLRQAARELSAA